MRDNTQIQALEIVLCELAVLEVGRAQSRVEIRPCRRVGHEQHESEQHFLACLVLENEAATDWQARVGINRASLRDSHPIKRHRLESLAKIVMRKYGRREIRESGRQWRG